MNVQAMTAQEWPRMGLRSYALRSILEKSVAVALLILLSGAAQALLVGFQRGPSAPPPSDARGQMLFVLMYSFVGVMAMLRAREVFSLVLRSPLVGALLLLAVLSPLWSVAADVSLKRSIALVGTHLFGLYLATRFTGDEAVRVIAVSLVAAALLSTVAVVALPEVAIMEAPHEGAWRGLFVHKNILGRVMGLGVLACVVASTLKRSSAAFVAGGLICAAVMLASQSRTAMLVTAMSVVFALPTLRVLRARVVVVIPLIIVGAVCVAAVSYFVTTNWADLLSALGRDPTLTGRTALWASLLLAFLQRPLLGYGFSGYWSSRGAEIATAAGWEAQHSHNGMLDLALDLGLVGVATLLVCYVVVTVRAAGYLRKGRLGGPFPLAFVIMLFGFGLSESVFVKHNSIFWAIFVWAAYAIARPAALQRSGGTNLTGISRHASAGQLGAQ